MAWKSEGVESRLQTIHAQGERIFSESRKFKRRSHKSRIVVPLYADDVTVSAKPYTLETLKLTLNEDYEGHGILKELIAGIRDGNALAYIGRQFDHPLFNIKIRLMFGDTKYVDEFYFDNDMLLGVRPSYRLIPALLCYKPPVVDEKTRPYFDDLKSARPDAARSIETCLKQFEIPQSQYADTSSAKYHLLPLVTGSNRFMDNQFAK